MFYGNHPRYAAGALDITGARSAELLEGVGAYPNGGALAQLWANPAFQQCLAAACQQQPPAPAGCDPCGRAQNWMPMVGPGGYSAPGLGMAYGGNPMVQEHKIRQFRELPLGFHQASIAPSTPTNVTSRPQVLFRGERLVIPATVAANFALLDVKVGNVSILVNDTQLPAAIFSEVAIGVRLSMDTAQVAQDISINVSNTSNTAHDFDAALIGTAAY